MVICPCTERYQCLRVHPRPAKFFISSSFPTFYQLHAGNMRKVYCFMAGKNMNMGIKIFDYVHNKVEIS